MQKKNDLILFVSQNIDDCDLETRRAVLRYIHDSEIPISEKGGGSQIKFSQLKVKDLRHIKNIIDSYLASLESKAT